MPEKKNIEFKISILNVDVKDIQIASGNPPHSDIPSFDFQIRKRLQIRPLTSTCSITLEILFSGQKINPDISGRAVIECGYHIANLNELIDPQNQVLHLDTGLIRHLIGLSISIARGVMVSEFRLKSINVLLPLFDPAKLMTDVPESISVS